MYGIVIVQYYFFSYESVKVTKSKALCYPQLISDHIRGGNGESNNLACFHFVFDL